jgi:hypothetical protein
MKFPHYICVPSIIMDVSKVQFFFHTEALNIYFSKQCNLDVFILLSGGDDEFMAAPQPKVRLKGVFIL